MITFTKAYQSSDGQTWPTLALAQDRELNMLLGSMENHSPIVSELLAHKSEVIAILSDKGNTKPRKPRRDKGTKRKAVIESARAASRLVGGEVL